MTSSANTISETLIFKTLIVGASNVGKSCLVTRYTMNQFMEKTQATLGYDMKIKDLFVKGKTVKLQMYDTAGDPRFQLIQSSYYKGVHAVMIVFDITDESSFKTINKIIEDVENYAPKEVIVYLVGNKCDLESQRVVSQERASALADEKNYVYFETSAKTADNVESTFQNLAERLVKEACPFDLSQSIRLVAQKDLREKACCANY